MNNNEKTLKTYGQFVKDYLDEHKNDIPETDWLKSSLDGIPKSAKMFEVGSGTGRDAKFIRSLGYNLQTSDAPDELVEHLQKENLNPIKFNLITDRFQQTYDYILANAVLVHFSHEEVEAALAKIFNALNGGGAIRV